MSTEKNSEVVACDAAIMKSVWEIREREQDQRKQQEQERLQKSALSSINEEWAGRFRARQGNYKRVESKTKPADTQIENENFWKGKAPVAHPPLPRGAGPGSFGRPGAQSRGFSSQTPGHKNKKGQDKSFNRLQSLMFITQTQPCSMVWGKSWKYNKSLPPPAEATSDWGQCWMFATQQPHSEADKPNGPNMKDPHSLHLWNKPDYRLMETEELDVSLPAEKWQSSWRKSNPSNKKDPSSVNEENVSRYGFFTMLLESLHHDKTPCSEWSDSWRSTKAASQQDHLPDEALINESVMNTQDKKCEVSSMWEDCWRISNLHGCNKSEPQSESSHSPEWENSWRAATVVNNNHGNSDRSLRPDDNDSYDDSIQWKQSFLQKIKLESNEHKYKDLYLQLYNEFNALSEWSKSWQVTKNNSQPCEEIEKVLKAQSPKMETTLKTQTMEKCSSSEEADPDYEQLKHDIIYWPKRGFTQSKLQSLRSVENVSFSSNWMDSWKTLKHRMRVERRRTRPDPMRPFRESEDRDTRSTASEWKDSWKYRCQPLQQEPELWQGGWSTTPQVRVDRARYQDHFAPVELPKNGPTAEQTWGASWKSTRRQQRSQPLQGNAQSSQGSSSAASNLPSSSQAQRRYHGSSSDWQASWMVSDSQFHHDTPSLIQWSEAWRCSAFHTENGTEQGSTQNCVDEVMEIQPMKEKMSLQRAEAKMSWTLDDKMFRERYPEKQWSTSWRAESLLNHQTSYHRSSGQPGKALCNTTQQHQATADEDGSKWGSSFRLANPMPLVEKPWLESSPNLCHHTVLWSRGNNAQNKIYTNLNNNPTMYSLWRSSYLLLQEPIAQIKQKSKSEELVDPRVIITKKIQTRTHLFSNIENEKQSEKTCPGGHLIGKTQPRPKKVPASEKKVKMADETKDKFFEGWAESWRSLDLPGGVREQMPMKSPSGWAESWKFLLPLYQTTSGPKAK
ncbi:uncharacterized protein LOC117771303 [Hippoglossus hippoglossus]|uniref:uncharacterized protein LOC117771303 n=1 Tax=Hippoglossus hippoglossus TaxID=8267 RepID=UPI00148BE80B|nr:uncharacterized protein LOC117771303 [Hippoglossus hippoglossus]